MTTEAKSEAIRTIDVSGTAPVAFTRLVAVEWRKMLDTRAGRWLIGITVGLIVLAMAITLLVVALDDSATTTAQGMADIMQIPVGLLVPVFGVLTITWEWGQRTHMVTFTLEPNRVRVILAKMVAVGALALSALVVAIAVGALTNVLAAAVGGYDVMWNMEWDRLGWIVLITLLWFLMAFGLGMLLLSSPGAIAVYYVVGLILPVMVYPPLWIFFDWARDLLPWVDLNTASMPFVAGEDFEGMPLEIEGVHYAQLLVTTAIYVLAPVWLGMQRVLRTEVK